MSRFTVGPACGRGGFTASQSFNPNNRVEIPPAAASGSEGAAVPAVPNDRHIPSHMTKVPLAGNGAAGASQARSSVNTSPASADRAERFLNRLDRELVGLDRVQRDAFLRRQIENWEARYFRFIRSEGKSEFCADPKNPIHVNDFICTIAGLHKRWNAEV